MAELRYLGLADMLALHQAIMEKFGVAPASLRDEGALEFAIMRPQMAAHYSDADLLRQAALLAVGVSQAQAFVDGNKRLTFGACDVFLRLNGLLFIGEALALAKELEVVSLRTGNLQEATDRLEAWLRANVAPRTP